ncbi:MAG: trehalase-like domain-containing protein [bacterium]
MDRISYLRYSIFGNRRTAALVSPDGSIDWCCLPHLDSPTVFSALVDQEKGGYFRIKPTDAFSSYQHYIRTTNVIETAFKTMSGAVILTDFMPVIKDDDEDTPPEIIRVLRCCDGEMKLEIDYYPKFNYGKGWNKLSNIPGGILTRNYDETAVLVSDVNFSIDEGHARTRITILSGEEVALVFTYGVFSPSKKLEGVLEKLTAAVRYWRGWVPHGGIISDVIKGVFYDALLESRLILKLVTDPVTCMVVESPIISRHNSSKESVFTDGRLCRLYGMSTAMLAFAYLGYQQETEKLFKTLLKISKTMIESGTFQNVFRINGDASIKDISIQHSQGESVCIRQYALISRSFGYYSIGLVMYAVYEALQLKDTPPEPELWNHVKLLITSAIESFPHKDGDFWGEEEKNNFVLSKILCWTAVDRGIKLAREYGLEAEIDSWEKSRSHMHAEILAKGYNTAIKSFVRAYDSTVLDATALLIPRFGFLPCDDEKIISTVASIKKHLVVKNYIVAKTSGTISSAGYSMCSFWLADCLARMGKEKEAKEILTSFLSLTDPLLLFPQMLDAATEDFKGLYPHICAHAEYILSLMAIQATNK